MDLERYRKWQQKILKIGCKSSGYGGTMYHGENQIAIASQNLISDVFLGLLEIRAFSSISVRDLCKEANVSRQTFYSLFETKENIISFVLETRYPLDLNHLYVDNERLDVYDICQGFGEYIFFARSFLKKVIACELTQLITEHFYQSILHCERFYTKTSTILDENEGMQKKYHAAFIAGGLTNMLKIYLDDERGQDSKDVTRLCFRLLSGKER